MSEFFKTSTTWIVDFRYDGQARRWYKLLRPGQDAKALMSDRLGALYGARAELVDLRPATPDEEALYLRGEEPRRVLCPTGRRPRTEPCTAPPSVSSNPACSTTPLTPDALQPQAPPRPDAEA